MHARIALLRNQPASPLVTDCTQGRVELSHATFDNWVRKTVNFLRLELDVDEESVVSLDLPLHWMSAVWLVAVWESGADVSLDPDNASVRVGTAPGVDVLVVPDAFGMASAPSGVSANAFFPADVRGMPDALVLAAPTPGGMAAGIGAEELATQATEYATAVGLHTGGRLLTDLAPVDLPGILAAIAAPLSAGAAVVYGGDPEQEGTTAIATH